MYCRKEMVKILKCYLIPKKSYGTLSKDAIFFGQPCILQCGVRFFKWPVFFCVCIKGDIEKINLVHYGFNVVKSWFV